MAGDSLDFNHRPRPPTPAEAINALVDAALVTEDGTRPRREYLGGSRLGDPCARRLQYEHLDVPRDPGTGFSGLALRIFAVGHIFEDLAIGWLRRAGFDLRTRSRAGEQFGFSVAGGRMQGHIDGVVVAAPPQAIGVVAVPALWECKSANARSWKEIVRRGVAAAKPIYAAQIALYQAYMGLADAPALFTAVNKDTSELHHELVPFDGALAQATSDKAVRVLQACDAGEWLPRIAAEPDHVECARCPWRTGCWA
jgi:hypothetical protein